jgi:hypothetical protein
LPGVELVRGEWLEERVTNARPPAHGAKLAASRVCDRHEAYNRTLAIQDDDWLAGKSALDEFRELCFRLMN